MRRVVFTVLLAASPMLRLFGDTPDIYAIRGARLVTVSGKTIDNGTIVIRDGVIDAVGAGATPPREATVIDGTRLTVYPGLIDLGHTGATESAPLQPLQNARTTSEVERWKRQQLLRPQVRAADIVKVDDADMMRLAASGITTVLAVPPGEVMPGQSALVNVAAAPERPPVGGVAANRRALAIVKSPVALHVSFPSRPRAGTNAYPLSLLGVIAFIRQAFLDAQYYALEQAHHRAPADDPALVALQPALERKLPVAFEANAAREILRALKLAREMNLDPIITGAREADAVVHDIIAARARVIVSLNYPQRSRALAPDDDEPIRELEARAAAPRTPGALARAGIRFGFASGGLSDGAAVIRNAAKAIKAGLGADAAVRAFTVDAATIAGVGSQLGALEKGKRATIIVTDGDLFDDKTRVVRVFIDGYPVPLPDTPSPSAARNAPQ